VVRAAVEAVAKVAVDLAAEKEVKAVKVEAEVKAEEVAGKWARV